METIDRKNWRPGLMRYHRFWCFQFSIGSVGVLICQPFRGNRWLTFYNITEVTK